ncbi:MAG TPA: hypothetical protein VN455_06450 [Methanotrichaceae archaeon]|nr:hypothetical protein [Methanotrichaceae archaeon]
MERSGKVYQTISQKLSRLNWTVAVFEVETDAGGNVQEKFWEWK